MTAIHPRSGKLIYHLTSVNNFESIVKNGLMPRNLVSSFLDIASPDILLGREKYGLGNFVPFHFFVKTPFCGIVQKQHEDIDFLYLTIRRENAQNLHFRIIPSHPLNFDREPLEWEAGMDSIDWDLMSKRDYADHDCKEACMAEAVHKGILSIDKIDYIYTRTNEVKELVDNLLRENGIRINVSTASNFFVT
jgi:hypothetical protein